MQVGWWGAHAVAGQPQETEITRDNVTAGLPCESCAERLQIISHLPCPEWLMLAATTLPSVDSEPLGWGESKFVAVWSRPSDQWQGGGRSWGRARRGLGRGKERFLCNGVENTKERQTDAFVIFVFLHPLLSFSSVSPSGSSDLMTSIALTAFLFSFIPVLILSEWHWWSRAVYGSLFTHNILLKNMIFKWALNTIIYH